MTDSQNTAASLELARQAEEEGLRELTESRERRMKEAAEKMALAESHRAEDEELERRFGALKAQREHEERLAAVDAAIAETSAAYRKDADVAARDYEEFGKAIQRIADSYGKAIGSELARLRSGEAYKAAQRQMEELAPGRVNPPNVEAKRLVTGISADVQKIVLEARPELRAALDQLTRFAGWKAPEYAVVMGQTVRVG